MTIPVGHKFPECRFGPLASRQVADYAAASGDDNPIHSDPQLARSFGFSAPLVQGLFMMGLFESTCRSWGLSGTISEIESRFVSPVPHGAELRYFGTVAAIEADRLRIRILVRDVGDVLCLVGSLLLRLD